MSKRAIINKKRSYYTTDIRGEGVSLVTII